MANPCVWIILLPGAEAAGPQAAALLARYGLQAQGQRWPHDRPQPWLASAQQAASAGAGYVVVAGSAQQLAEPALRRGLALFRLHLQTLRGRIINGCMLLNDAGGAAAAGDAAALGGAASVLDDWLPASASWGARAVARLHAPTPPRGALRLGLHAHERLGVWLEARAAGAEPMPGCCVGVAGDGADISFHAVGPAGRLPERTLLQYELKGLEFDCAGRHFKAWGARNELDADHSYYVRLEGEPEQLAVGDLRDGELGEVDLVAVA